MTTLAFLREKVLEDWGIFDARSTNQAQAC